MATQQVTDSNFDTEVLKSGTPVLVDFWAEWCGPCRGLAPKLEELAKEMDGKVRIVKINVDDNPNTASKFQIRSIPTMLLFKNGQQVDQVMGNVAKENIASVISKHI